MESMPGKFPGNPAYGVIGSDNPLKAAIFTGLEGTQLLMLSFTILATSGAIAVTLLVKSQPNL